MSYTCICDRKELIMSATPQRLQIGDKSQWAFFNGDWEDAADGGL